MKKRVDSESLPSSPWDLREFEGDEFLWDLGIWENERVGLVLGIEG